MYFAVRIFVSLRLGDGPSSTRTPGPQGGLKAKADEACILDYSMSFNVVELHRKLLREAVEHS